MKTAYCFDLDGTITQQEILVLLAKELRIENEIELLTLATISGILPFESSFKLRVKLLSLIPISRVKEITNQVILSDKIVNFIKQHQDNSYIITGNLDVYIEDIVKKIGCITYSSKANIQDGCVHSIGYTMNKSDAISIIKNLGYDRIISIGDGSNDIPMFEESDISIAYFAVNETNKNLIKCSDIVIYDEESLCKILKML